MEPAAVTGRTLPVELTPASPFVFRDTLFAHGWLRLAPFRWDEEEGTLWRIERLPSGRVVRIGMTASDGASVADRIRVATQPEAGLSASDRRVIEERVRWMLGLDDDLTGFHALCASTPGLSHAAERRQGRLLRCPTVFEELIKTLCCVNARWAQSVRMAARLVARYGEPLPGDGDARAFPEPAALAAAEPAAAQEFCRLGYRAARMIATARQVADGELDLESLKDPDLPTQELLARLLTLPGVGPYAAAHVASLLGRHEVLGIDSWVREVARKGWFAGAAVSDREIARAFDRYHPYQSLVYRCFDWEEANRGFREQVEGGAAPQQE